MSTLKKINYGCGSNKWPGYINIDIEETCKPDMVCDLRKSPLPFESNSIEQFAMLHVIEHIEEKYHEYILTEIYRVLVPSGILFIAYPEFLKCVDLYKNNTNGNMDFWKKTIYGRQLNPGDYHVALMDSRYFKQLLELVGFKTIKCIPEKLQEFNTFIKAIKDLPQRTYEQVISETVWENSYAKP
jgi:ubiquinone/menaquinone biosynthesis C-methylase UbiE